MTLSTSAAVLLALFCGAWLVLAAWLSVRASRRTGVAAGMSVQADRAGALLAASPSMPLLVDGAGGVETSVRLAHALGLDAPPERLDELTAGSVGLAAEDLANLDERVRTSAATGASFALAVRAQGSARVFVVRGGPAPAPASDGSVLLWFIDATESEEQIAALQERVERLGAALDALSGLIEAAPFPMWHRGPDLRVTRVNGA